MGALETPWVVGLLGGPRDAGVASLEIAGVLGLARGRHRDQVGFLRDLEARGVLTGLKEAPGVADLPQQGVQ